MNQNPIGRTPTLADQRTSIGALAALVGMFGHLPAGYISVDDAADGFISLSLPSPAAVESWREALGLAPSAVTLHVHNDHVWLTADAEFLGASIHMRMHTVPVSFEAAVVSPAEDAARFREGLLAEQRHQLVDAAEPVLCVASMPAAWSAAAVSA